MTSSPKNFYILFTNNNDGKEGGQPGKLEKEQKTSSGGIKKSDFFSIIENQAMQQLGFYEILNL